MMNKSTVDRFLEELRRPLPRQEVEQAAAHVLSSLEAGQPARLPLAVVPAVQDQPIRRWVMAAAVMVVIGLSGILIFALLRTQVPAVVARTADGRTYMQGEVVRATDGPEHLFLLDGSHIEMSPNAILSIADIETGVRIFLAEGQMIVTAAKPRGGPLYVETKDCEISVLGTVFSVNAGPAGSRVSVVEGEVQVRQGDRTQTLLPGQQVSTSAAVAPPSVKADIAWSSKAPELVALLQQAATVVPPAAAPAGEPGTVNGIVTHEETGAGIPDVVINLCALPAEPTVTVDANGRVTAFSSSFALTARQCETQIAATTDSAGRFVIRDVGPGRYVVRALKSGYLAPLEKSLSSVAETSPLGTISRAHEKWGFEGGPPVVTEAITVGGEPRAVEVTIALARPASLTGKVRGVDGRFAAFVPVHIGVPSRAGTQTSFRRLAAVNTNASGDYRFRVPPGDYLIFAGSLPQDPLIPMPSSGALWISLKEGDEITASILTAK